MFNNSIKEKIKDEIKRRGIMLCLDGVSKDAAVKTAEIAQRCGINTFAVSLRSEFSGQTLNMLRDALGEDAIIGADDVFCTDESDGDVEYACQNGAKFVSSPICSNLLTDKARELDCVCIGGGETLKEIFDAHKKGGGFVRFSCAAGVSAERIAEIRDNISYINLCVSGDIPMKTLNEYFDAGLSLYILRCEKISILAGQQRWNELEEFIKEKVSELKNCIKTI